MKISLSVGESEKVSLAGGRFYYESGLGRIRVRTLGAGGAEFELSPGMGFQNKEGQPNFEGLEILNLHSEAQTIEFIVSYREVFDNRVSFGKLAVENEKDLAALGGGVFIANFYELYSSPDTTKLGAMIRNDAGLNVYIRKIFVRQDQTSGLQKTFIGIGDYAAVDSSGFIVSSSSASTLKMNTSTALPVPSQVRALKFAGNFMEDYPSQIKIIDAGLRGKMNEIDYGFPIVLPVGKALYVQNGSSSSDLHMTIVFEKK